MTKEYILHEFGFRINNGSVIGGNNWPIDRLNAMADEIIKLRQSQDVVDRYIKESLLDIQLLEGIAKAMFDRNEQHSVDTYNWKGYTARLWNKQFPDVTDYWVMLAQTALKEFYEKTNLY
jgi:hypothetical protein